MDIPLRFHVSIGAGERKTHKVNEVKLLLLPLRLLSSRQTKLLYSFYFISLLFLSCFCLVSLMIYSAFLSLSSFGISI
jgi:hypothetical protein